MILPNAASTLQKALPTSAMGDPGWEGTRCNTTAGWRPPAPATTPGDSGVVRDVTRAQSAVIVDDQDRARLGVDSLCFDIEVLGHVPAGLIYRISQDQIASDDNVAFKVASRRAVGKSPVLFDHACLECDLGQARYA